MLYLRTAAVGLIFSAIFLAYGAVDFAQLAINGHMPSSLSLALGRVSPTFAFFQALGSLDAQTASMTGANIFIPAFYILCCLGLGFFVAALVWPPFDNGIRSILEAGQELTDKFFSKRFDKFSNKSKKAVILSGILLMTAGMTTKASAGEFVPVQSSAQQQGALRARVEVSNDQILFPAGYSEKAVLVQGLRIAKNDQASYPVQIRTAKGDIFQAAAKIDSTAERFHIRLEQVIVKGKGVPVRGYIAGEDNTIGIAARMVDAGMGTPQNIATFSNDTFCRIVVTEAVVKE